MGKSDTFNFGKDQEIKAHLAILKENLGNQLELIALQNKLMWEDYLSLKEEGFSEAQAMHLIKEKYYYSKKE